MTPTQLNTATIAVLDAWAARGVKIDWAEGRVWFPECSFSNDLERNLVDGVWASIPDDGAEAERQIARWVFSFICKQQDAIEAGRLAHA